MAIQDCKTLDMVKLFQKSKNLSPVFEPVEALHFISLFKFEKLRIDIVLVCYKSYLCDCSKREKLKTSVQKIW